MPIVVLGLEISARTNMFLRLFGCLKATMGGLGKTLYIYVKCGCHLKLSLVFEISVQCSKMFVFINYKMSRVCV